MSLILSVSPDDAKPYRFKVTGINTYSLEEALYHSYHYWKESIDDFISDEFISWVNYQLNLSYIASKIRDIALIPQFAKRLLAFLTVADYFDDGDIAKLKAELEAWENRFEWEKFKERGDYLINMDQPDKAYAMYKKALAYKNDDPALLNNMGICLMKMGVYQEALVCLERSYELLPDDIRLIANLIEGYIYNANYDKAFKLLEMAQRFGENSDIYYLYGELYFAKGESLRSIKYYEKAVSICNDPHYVYRMTDVYIKLRLYDKAIENLGKVGKRDKKTLTKLAEVYASYHNVPAAVKCIESALTIEPDCAELWTQLAAYYRMDYDLERAYEKIMKAIEIDKDNERANLELARIKKAQGKIKDYQSALHKVLNMFKNKERDRSYS